MTEQCRVASVLASFAAVSFYSKQNFVPFPFSSNPPALAPPHHSGDSTCLSPRPRLKFWTHKSGHSVIQSPMHLLHGTTNAEKSAGDGVFHNSNLNQTGHQNMQPAKDSLLCAPLSGVRDSTACTLLQNQSGALENEVLKRMENGGLYVKSSGMTKNKMLDLGKGDSQTEGMTVKGFQSRERKKSKYLSPPYTNLSFRRKNMLVSKDLSETEDTVASKVACDGLDMNGTASLDSQSLLGSDVKKTKKMSRRFISSFNVPEIANASSAELLGKLHRAALDCLYPRGDGHFTSFERFFSMFRTSMFCDSSIAVLATEDGSQGTNVQVIQHMPAAGNSERKKRKMKTMETLTSSMENELAVDMPNGSSLCKRKYNRKMIMRREEKSSVGMTSILNGTLFDVATTCLYPDDFVGKNPLMADLNRTTDLAGSVIEVTEINWEDNEGSSFGLPNVNGISARHCSFVNDPLGMCFFSLENKVRKRSREGNATSVHPLPMHTGGLLDLNKNGGEFGSFGPGMNFHCPIPRRRRRRRKKSTDANQVEASEDAGGTALLMVFAPASAIPSKEAMIKTFCVFGRLKESETLVMEDSGSARVVFERSSDAGEAFRSLEKSRPFGSALINYRLHNHSGASRSLKLDSNLHMPLVVQQPKGLVVPVKPPTLNHQIGDQAPSLFLIRQNLEMMASMLEKSGDDLSSDMRAKLEKEIQHLLKKVSTMDGGSSS